MTLIIAAQGKNFVVLGADSRETVEPRISSFAPMRVEVNIAEKIVPLSRHSAILVCGDTGQAQYLVERFMTEREDVDAGVSSIAEEFKEFCRQEARKVADVPKYPNYFPDYGFIIAGLDKTGKRFRVPKCFSLQSAQGFRMNLAKEGFALDGKPMLAYYLFEKHYSRTEKDDPDALCELVGKTLYDTSRIDGDVGGTLRMALIRQDGFDWIPDTDVSGRWILDHW